MVGNNRLQNILDYRNLANTDPMKLMQLQNQTEMPMVNRAIGSQVGDGNQTQLNVKQDLNDMLTATMADGDSLAAKGLEFLVKRSGNLVQSIVEMSQQPVPVRATKNGGLIGMAAGGRFEGKVPGQGHGMEDNVYMPIKEGNQQVATLAVSPDEYVVDAHTMSALGNGNADEGAKYMDSMVKNIRQKAFGTDQQPNEINGLAALRPMMERV